MPDSGFTPGTILVSTSYQDMVTIDLGARWYNDIMEAADRYRFHLNQQESGNTALTKAETRESLIDLARTVIDALTEFAENEESE